MQLKCAISNAQDVSDALDNCSTQLGWIRGVVRYAMVLRDGLFEKMSHEQWIESTRPKVQGSLTLHQCLPDVDFSLILNSFADLFGNRGQSNYSAAGGYEDALSTYRRSLGMKYVTLDLGIMRDLGVLAEQGITDNLCEWEGPRGIDESTFHTLIDTILATELTKGVSAPQIATRYATARIVQEVGIESPWYFSDLRFSNFSLGGGAKGDSSNSQADGASIKTQMTCAHSLGEASTAVTSLLVRRIVDLLRISESEVDTSRPLHAFGIDSLVTVELANWIYKHIHSKANFLDLMTNVPITSPAEKLAAKSELVVHLSS